MFVFLISDKQLTNIASLQSLVLTRSELGLQWTETIKIVLDGGSVNVPLAETLAVCITIKTLNSLTQTTLSQ